MFDAKHVCAQATALRLHIIDMLTEAKSGHPGGSLSAADIVSVLYFGEVLRYDATTPDDPERDRFLLSKGHAAPVQYAALAQAGFFPVEELLKLRKLGAMLQGHPDALTTPGIEVSTGSLGQGLSIACGIAQTLHNAGGNQRVYCLLGDGELQEGQVWEAAMYAAHYQLENLTAIIDANNLQIDGTLDEVMSLGDIAMKFAAFGWDVYEIDGHDVEAIYKALTIAGDAGKPRAIVARTKKGCGVSFMEDKAGWHGMTPNREQADEACRQLRSALEGGGSHG